MKKVKKLRLEKFLISKIGNKMSSILGGSQNTTEDQTDDPPTLSDSSFDCTDSSISWTNDGNN